jgi:uncharacterized membrane protein
MREARPADQRTPLVVLVLGVVLVMIGQFVLDKLADTSDAWHWIQHGVLFAGGLAVGAAATVLYLAGRRLD